MTDKSHLLATLKDEFNRWEAILASLTKRKSPIPIFLPTGLSKM